MGPNTSGKFNDLAMNDLCFEYSQNSVCLNSFDCAFVDKEIRCRNKTEIKDGLQYTNKKSLPCLQDILQTRLEDVLKTF